MWSVNLNLLSIIIPKYFIVVTCCNGLLLNYMLTSLISFRFLLDITITLDFSSLKSILLFFTHFVILFISTFDIFSAALTVSILIANIKSSANATSLVLFVNWRFSRELYWMFQYPGPQQDPCGDPLVTVLCILIFLDEITADR